MAGSGATAPAWAVSLPECVIFRRKPDNVCLCNPPGEGASWEMKTEGLPVPEIGVSLFPDINTPDTQSFFHGPALQEEKIGLVLEIRGYGKYMGEPLPKQQSIEHGTGVEKDVGQVTSIMVLLFPVIFQRNT